MGVDYLRPAGAPDRLAHVVGVVGSGAADIASSKEPAYDERAARPRAQGGTHGGL
jgi:hypothetical protein